MCLSNRVAHKYSPIRSMGRDVVLVYSTLIALDIYDSDKIIQSIRLRLERFPRVSGKACSRGMRSYAHGNSGLLFT